MRLYDKFIYSILICLIHGNDLKISGPLLVDSTWDWLTSWCRGGCCGCNSCDSDCSNSGGSSSNSGEKLAEVILTNNSGTNYKHERVNSLITFTPNSGYSINVVKEKVKDDTKQKSEDGTEQKTEEGIKQKSEDGTEESKDKYNIIWSTEKQEEYASKVTLEYYDGVLTIYIGSNQSSKIVFKRDDDNKWTKDDQASTHKSSTEESGDGTKAANQTSGGTTGTDNSTGTDASADGGTQQSTPVSQ